MAAVCSGQHARHGGRSDRQGYGSVACMQPSVVPRRKYPDQCKREQSHLRWFAKFGLAREETGDDKSGSNSSHAKEFQFGVGYKRDGGCVYNGGCVLSPVIVTVVWHNFCSTLFFISLSPTLHIHSLILSFSLSYLFT